MLLEFSCSNHKSIRDEITFSLIAGADTTNEEYLNEFGELKVLKSAIIYGANGSGKSNFIDAISFVKMLVANCINYQPGQSIRQVPHKLNSLSVPSTYKVQFIVNNIRYAFGFTLMDMTVSEEYLYYFPNGRQAKIYERVGEEFTSGSKFRGKFKSCKDVLKPNRLFLSCAANFSSVKEIGDVFSFFTNDIVIYGLGNQENWMRYSLYQMYQNSKMKQAVLTFMNDLGTGIRDIKVKIDKRILEESQLPPIFSDEFKNWILQNRVDAITASVIYDGFSVDLLHEESTGVKKLFGMLCPLIDIITNNKILICDEIETSLHESIIYEVVKAFSNSEISTQSQLVFTTHETGLLNLDFFRRDQIWFTELKGDRSTDLYSLCEIKSVRREDNFKRGYITGKYGAIPMLNHELVDFVNQLQK